LNQPINKFFKEWNQARKSVLSGKSFKDEEGHFLLRELKDEKFLFNAYSIKTAEQEILGYLITFREYSSMLKLVNKYTGSQARYTFDNIIGQSKVIKETLRNAKTIADSPSTVLITGDSGTGKEVFAQAIHNASSRRDAGFVALNCGAISPSLIESELFGYDDGAFTGAKKGGNPGKFELANNGTLFLDEIGEMPMDMQVRLLRAIQEGSVQRIGSDKTTRVDVRIIAATNKNLEEEVKQGRFRLDLFYRLNVIPIRVPSLSERKEDLWTLLKYFLKHKAAKLRMPVPDIEIELLDRVMAYHWPGNVRELENFAEKLVILEGKLSLEMMDTEFRNILETIRPVKVVSPSAMMYEREIMTLDEMERRAISNAVNQLNGNMTLVAKRLGISRNTLYLKMKKYNLAIPEKSGSRT
jgi:transcriptional regulator with PAS, ATPase and Fis domain